MLVIYQIGDVVLNLQNMDDGLEADMDNTTFHDRPDRYLYNKVKYDLAKRTIEGGYVGDLGTEFIVRRLRQLTIQPVNIFAYEMFGGDSCEQSAQPVWMHTTGRVISVEYDLDNLTIDIEYAPMWMTVNRAVWEWTESPQSPFLPLNVNQALIAAQHPVNLSAQQGLALNRGNDLLEDLTFWLTFDEIDQGMFRDAHNYFNFALDNDPVSEWGYINNALWLDGTNNLLRTRTDDLWEVGDFSISAWVFCLGSGTDNNILSYTQGTVGGGLAFIFTFSTATNEMTFYISTNGSTVETFATGAATITDNAWHHVVVTYSTTTDKAIIYIDNTKYTMPGTYTADIVAQTGGAFYIGDNGADAAVFAGGIDELAYWKGRILSDADVAELYNGGDGLSYYDIAPRPAYLQEIVFDNFYELQRIQLSPKRVGSPANGMLVEVYESHANPSLNPDPLYSANLLAGETGTPPEYYGTIRTDDFIGASNRAELALYDAAQHWEPSGAAYLDFEFNEARAVTRIEIQVSDNVTPSGTPSHITISASQDGTSYTTILELYNESAWGVSENRIYSFDNETEYLFWRVAFDGVVEIALLKMRSFAEPVFQSLPAYQSNINYFTPTDFLVNIETIDNLIEAGTYLLKIKALYDADPDNYYELSSDFSYGFRRGLEAWISFDQITGLFDEGLQGLFIDSEINQISANEDFAVTGSINVYTETDSSTSIHFEAGAKLTMADNANFSVDVSEELSFGGWVVLYSVENDVDIVSKWNVNEEYKFWFDASLQRFVFSATVDGSTDVDLPADSFGSPLPGQRYFFCCRWRDLGGGTMLVQVNDASDDTALASPPFDGTSDLILNDTATELRLGQFFWFERSILDGEVDAIRDQILSLDSFITNAANMLLDSHGDNDLSVTSTGFPFGVPGLKSYASSHHHESSARTTYWGEVDAVDSPFAMRSDNQSFTGMIFGKLEDVQIADAAPFRKSGSGQTEYELDIDDATGAVSFDLSADGSAVTSLALGTYTWGDWAQFFAGYDRGRRQQFGGINGVSAEGTFNSAIFNGTAAFRIGQFAIGDFDEFAWWNRRLSDFEMVWLANIGASATPLARAYADTEGYADGELYGMLPNQAQHNEWQDLNFTVFESLAAMLSYYPNCNALAGRGFFARKPYTIPNTVYYSPQLWADLFTTMQDTIPESGYASNWHSGTRTYMVSPNRTLWNAPPISLYAFTNCSPSGFVTIKVNSNGQGFRVSQVALAQVHDIMTQRGYGGLLPSDILLIGDLYTREPGGVLRGDVIYSDVFPQINFQIPLALESGENLIEIQSGQFYHASLHFYRRM